MRTKALIIIIAIVLACGVAGTCFALYNMSAGDKTVNIRSEGTVVLDINTTENFALSGINPDVNVTLDVTLTVTGSPETGKKGTFTVDLGGALASGLDVATTINEVAKDTAALTTGVELDLAASTMFTLTFSIKDGVDFTEYADKVANVTLRWQTQNWEPQDKYYLVGTIEGITQWTPTSDAYVTSVPSDGNHAEFLNVSLNAGDKIKILNPQTNTWQGGFSGYNGGSVDGMIDGDGNFVVPANGTYDIYLNGSNQIYINKKD